MQAVLNTYIIYYLQQLKSTIAIEAWASIEAGLQFMELCILTKAIACKKKTVRDVQSLFANPPIMIFGLWLMLEMKIYMYRWRITGPCLFGWNAQRRCRSIQSNQPRRTWFWVKIQQNQFTFLREYIVYRCWWSWKHELTAVD